MTFVFIRHGHCDKPADRSVRSRQGLSAKGRADALGAGAFLLARGIVPDLVCRTGTERTRETAAGVLEALGVSCPVRDVGTGFREGASAGEIASRVRSWAALAPTAPGVLAFVGHEPQQNACLRQLAGGQITIHAENKACVLVFTLDGDDWRVGPHHPGS